MFIKRSRILIVLGILWGAGLQVFAPGWYTLQILVTLSLLGAAWMDKVLTRPCPHCGTPGGRAARRCPACKRRPHEESNPL